MNSLLKKGRVVRGCLVIAIQDLDEALVEALKLPGPDGVLVADVTPDSPAHKAGLKREDVVLGVDGRKVDSAALLRNLVAFKGAGVEVTLTLLRRGTEKSISVKLGELPTDGPPAAASKQKKGVLAGVTVAELTAQLRRKHRVPARLKRGVVVVDVEPGSTAASGGLKAGDVVIELNRTPMDSVEAFNRACVKSPNRVVLVVLREGNTFYLVLQQR